MAQSSKPADQQRVEDLVGVPGEHLLSLKERIQDHNVTRFSVIECEFLNLLWSIDAYRVEQVIPRAPAGAKVAGYSADQLAGGIYRKKGNFFSEIVTAILSNKTDSPLAPHTRVRGFSQLHRVDIAWPAPDRGVAMDPIVCCEVKLSGAPGFGDTPSRNVKSDWTNRRKELKFQAADLKLYRQRESAETWRWDQWRQRAAPRVYAIWAGRLQQPADLDYMLRQARELTDTYLDSVGVYGFITNDGGDGYVPVTETANVAERATSLDAVLDLVADEIADGATH
ncbi:hypothetical protein CBR64_20725 [Cellulosimicrobium cellulans]|uniref:Restriction endonuclease n=1 Tax=Cellulosimicrobium cellulans TaxID=1710 RepID=A0A1Y0HZB2_CELCE|nr:hypothetical protein [Cellulosimicrobium cellulans]ARU53491.1 hypothetical protein CBR64_20725 [Cellulosimicrobium cellulans]